MWIALLIFIVVAVFLILFLAVRNKQKSLQIDALRDELRMSEIKNSISQTQPHFLYNALASIREIVLEDPQHASDLIYDFTTYLRASVRSLSGNELVSFGQELENIKAYVNIEKMRFGDKLKIQYNIECVNFKVVPLSIQPIVENAIRHGIFKRGAKGGTLIVSSFEEKNRFVIIVKDDGVGFDFKKISDEIQNGERDSTGLKNLIFRLEKILNAKVIVDSVIGTGTTVTVKIPK